MKILTTLFTPLSWLIPRHMEQGSGGGALGYGGDTASGAAANPAALAQAEEIEKLNARIREMEAGRVEDIRLEAERLLMEVMPEIGNGQDAQVPSFEPEPERMPMRHSEGDGGESDIQAIMAHLQRLEAGQVALEERVVGNSADAQFAAMKQKHPMMDEVRVRLYMANLGNAAEQVNIDTLCRISHDRELARLQNHAQQYHLAEMARINGGIPAGGSGQQSATLPGRPSAVPTGGVPITAENAARVLAEKLRAAGFERQQ